MLLHHMSIRLEDYLSGSFPTCIQQSATDGYLRNEDCRELHPFVCEVKKNVAFTQPSEGMPIHFTFLLVYWNGVLFRNLHNVTQLPKWLSKQL